jgi:hypothetical protein
MKVNIHRRGHARPLLYILKVIKKEGNKFMDRMEKFNRSLPSISIVSCKRSFDAGTIYARDSSRTE